MRVDKLLAHMGYGSRKEIKKWIKGGLVLVNHQPARDGKQQVNPEKDQIQYKGEKVEYREFIYLMLNKPQGVICATEDRSLSTVMDLLTEQEKALNLFPVGRLDKDTEGLVLMTNDGQLAHRLLSPKRHVPKIYFAQVEGEVDQADQAAFLKGVLLEDGYQTMPAQLKIIESAPISKVELTIYEGKYHQVKRMFGARRKRVVYLKRLSMAQLFLDPSLLPGEYRSLFDQEIGLLMDDSRANNHSGGGALKMDQ